MSLDYSHAYFWKDKPEAWNEIMPGVKRRILSHSQTGMMVYYKIEAGSTFAWHNHPHSQFGVIVEGAGRFSVGDVTREVKSGDTYIIPPTKFQELVAEKKCLILDYFTPERLDYVKEALPPDSV